MHQWLISINHMTPYVVHTSGRLQLIWHNGVIPASGIWIILGGDKGRGAFNLWYDVAAPNSMNNTGVHVLRMVIVTLICT